MSSNDVTLRTILTGEDRSASKAIKQVGDAADSTTGKLKSGWAGAGKVMGGVLGADMVKKGAQELWDFGKASVEAFRDAARSQRDLEDAYDRFPALADVNIDKMRELNQAIQDKTGADADDIAASQAVLARHKLTGDQISRLTPLLVDYAKRTGTDLPSAGDKLGKALAGNARAMKELGIPFKNTGDAAGNFDQIMSGLQDKVGGFAEKEAQTLDGKLGMLETRFGDVQEEIGAALLPVLVDLVDLAMEVVGWIQENAEWLGPLATALGIVTVAVIALNAAMSANPISLVVLAIAALVAGLVYAYNESETFRTIVDAAFAGIAAAARWLWNNALQPVLQFLVTGFAQVTWAVWALLDQLGNIPGFEWAKDAAEALFGVAKGAEDVASAITKIPDEVDIDTGSSASDLDKVGTEAGEAGKNVKNIPPKAKVDTEKTPEKLDEVKKKAKGAESAVKEIPGKKNVDINIRRTGIDGIRISVSGGGAAGAAGGAGSLVRVKSFDVGGRPKVGELALFHADELWVPDTAGTVLTKRQTANFIGSGPSPIASAGVGGGTVSYYDVRFDLHGVIDGPAAVRALEPHFVGLMRERNVRPATGKGLSFL